MRVTGEGKAAKPQFVKYRDFLIETRAVKRADGWGTHVHVWRAIGGQVVSAELTSTEVAHTQEEADRRCIDYAIREIQRGIELK